MSEEFYITAPRARRTLHRTDGLWDLFFGRRPIDLVPHLIVPVPITKKGQLESEAAALSGSWVATYQRKGLNTRPSQKKDAIAPQSSADATKTTDNSKLTFITLPLEIYPVLFNQIKDLADLMCLGIAAPTLWGIIYRIVFQRYRSKLGRWAGQAIVCVGNRIPVGDYPPGLFSELEVEKLNNEVIVWRSNKEKSSPITLANLFDSRNGGYEKVDVTVNTEATKAFYACVRRLDRNSSFVVQAKLMWIYTGRPAFTPRNEKWILRNLTTKEFVTSEGIALDKDYINGPYIFAIGFGHAVVVRTLWTANKTLKYGREMGRGVWAGHRFDITTRSRHDEATKGEEWKDVSEEVADEIAVIWRNQFGPDWVEERYSKERRFYDESDEDYDERDPIHEFDVALETRFNTPRPY